MSLLLAWLLAPNALAARVGTAPMEADQESSNDAALSRPIYPTERLTNLRMRARDGIVLVADAVRPRGHGRFPAILERTPEGRDAALAKAAYWAARGYVYVVQDCRGRGRSGGDWTPFVNEGKDGYDAVEWTARQPWCDGNVGMAGASYAAAAQWQAAVERPSALRCIVPRFTPSATLRDSSSDDGTFGSPKGPRLNEPSGLPLGGLDDRARLAEAQTPALHVSDGDDEERIGTELAWEAMRRAGRKDQWLVYGPGGRLGFDLDLLTLRFYDTYLKGRSVGMQSVPRARAYVTGAERWIALDGWPASNAPLETRYLAPGALSRVPGEAGAAVYHDDPAASRNGAAWPRLGTYALFKGEPLAKAMAIGGPFEVRLFFRSGGQDTDLFATLIDLAPNGSMRRIGVPGRLRGAIQDHPANRTPRQPGRLYAALIRPGDAAHELPKGHRLALWIAGSAFPTEVRNGRKGETPRKGKRMVPPKNVILTGTLTPSRITYRRLW